MSSNEMTGGEALARMFQAYGVGPMFGMGGFQLLPFYDAVRRLGLGHNLVNDERFGAFAADAYAKVSGRVGVIDATLGPGATNLVTGLVESLNSGTPIVALVGDSHRAHSWKNMTQESRQTEILAPAAKEMIRVERIERIPELMTRAFAVATSGRPGPVVVDVPEDIAHDTFPFDPAEFEVDPAYQSAPSIRSRPARADVERAAALIARARKPMILAGGGVHISRAWDALHALATAAALPVAHTMTGKGAIACTDPLSAGLFGRYDRIANSMIGEADVLLVIGCKLGEIATKRYVLPGAGKTIIHLDILAEEFDRTTAADVRLWGDAREGCLDLAEALSDSRPDADRRAWADSVPQRMATWRASVQDRLTSGEVPVNMARMLNELNGMLPDDALLVADGGFAAHWGGLLYDQPRAGRGFVPDRGFASIGYGLPGAAGAKLAAPERTTFAITGDGGFNMMIGELETARRLGIGFALMVVNNAASGYVKALQHLMYGTDAYQSSDLKEVNYAKVAEAMGCRGIRVENPDQLQAAIAAGIETTDGPCVIDVVVTRDPARMLPAVDNRTVQAKKGDRVA
ncbi:MAG: thiamine pyrophosphate-binding protein [Minwuia sp.]|nr:thiamine pyrophosphate-binding protein [Minwuia sp.]